jgi:hypothetical protein
MNITLLGDIAGRVSEASANADRVTACTVCLPTGALKQIRRSVVGMPKWRDCCDDDVIRMINLLHRETLSICVISLAKNVDAWARFWTEGTEAHQRLSNEARGSISILKPGMLVKYALFSQASTLSVGHAVKLGAIVRASPLARRLQVNESHIYDNDIEGNEATDAFADIWRKRNEHQPLVQSLGLELKARTLRLTTEEQEPLLLLPDYVAGIAHAKHSAADTLSNSAVSRVCALHAIDRLQRVNKYHEVVEPFSLLYYEIYPDFRPSH